MNFCKIILLNSKQKFPKALNCLTYSIPDYLKTKAENQELKIGSFATVPIRDQKEIGLIIDIFEKLDNEDQGFKIKEIEDLVSTDIIISLDLIELIKFISEHYCCTYSEVLSAAIPAGLIRKPEIEAQLTDPSISLDHPVIRALSKARKNKAKFSRLKVLTKMPSNELKKELRKLEAKQLIKIEIRITKKRVNKNLVNPLEKLRSLDPSLIPDLTKDQSKVLDYIQKTGEAKFLIHGVTGSGKTEIYLRMIEETFSKNKSTIFLVPEISLAPQLIERIAQRFGDENVLIWHSALSLSEREYTWNELSTGLPKVIVGARSAIFAPVDNLGLIIIDEEHENSYKQESPAPRYHARLAAQKRAEYSKSPIIYGSATPSVELYYKAKSDEFPDFHLLEMNKRVFNNPLPEVKIVDMREEFLAGNKTVFSKILREKIETALNRKEQIILFLNKRGSASHVFCRTCGYVYQCPDCDTKMVFHSDVALMICHHCGHKEEHPKECPQCQMPTIKFFGLGTQKLAEEAKRAFPTATISRLDSDVSRIKNNYIKVWNDFRDGSSDILIGTQMIAKGLDIANLTTVGVISADSSFSQLDYLAEERGFQLLTQVAGRAGRHDKPGSVVFQTYQPDRVVLHHSKEQDYAKFYKDQIIEREDFIYPPYSTLVRFTSAAEDQVQAIEVINKFHELICSDPDLSGLECLGPSPCMLSRINKKFRYHLLLKIPSMANLDSLKHKARLQKLKELYLNFKKPKDLSFTIDVDNISLY